MTTRARPRVLCVDDEQRVLEGLAIHLRKDYDVHVALNGEQALRQLSSMKGAAVVVADMRMPGMDGATLLREVMQRHPDATRILLTGEAGRDVAVSAVNKGQIFRFLTKPCPPDQFKAAVEAGVDQHRLINAERAILQETLIGCIEALMDTLALANPAAFGRASRLKRLAMDFAATQLEMSGFWQLEAAAMLSQIGYLALPPNLMDRIYSGARLTAEESALATGAPEVAIKLLERIPRLEPVAQILTALNWSDAIVARLGEGTIGLASRILGMVMEYETLMCQGHPADVAVQSLRTRSTRFGDRLIDLFAAYLGARAAEHEILELPLGHVVPGMVLLEDVRTPAGILLVPKGFEVTPLLLERIPHFGPEFTAELVRVRAAATGRTAAEAG